MQETKFGKVTSMLISMSSAVTSAFIWLEALPKQISQATLHIKRGDAVTKIVDANYPFEFSVPLAQNDKQFECWVEAVADGKTVRSESVQLKR